MPPGCSIRPMFGPCRSCCAGCCSAEPATPLQGATTTMNTSTEQPSISRRQLLRYRILNTLVLGTAGRIASVTRTLRSGPGTGCRQLRESHIPMLRRIIPVILDGALPAGDADAAVQAVLDGLDRSLDHLSPAMRSQSLQLFDLLSLDL